MSPKQSRAFLWLIIIFALAAFAVGDFSHIRLGTDLKGGTELVFFLDLTPVPKGSRKSVATQVKEIISRRLDGFGLKELNVTVSGTDRLFIQIPGSKSVEVNRFIDLIESSGELSMHIVSPESSQTPAAKEAAQRADEEYRDRLHAVDDGAEAGFMPVTAPHRRLVWSLGARDDFTRALVVENTEADSLNGSRIRRAFPSLDSNGFPAVTFQLDSRGGPAFREAHKVKRRASPRHRTRRRSVHGGDDRGDHS